MVNWTFDFSSASSIPACMMFMGGRPAKAAWEHFVRVESYGKTVARCKLCGHQMSTKCDRMQVHYSKCSNITSTPAPMPAMLIKHIK